MQVIIVVGGQLEKEKIAELIREHSNYQIDVLIEDDINASLKVKNQEAHYYIGACNTGGGGALAMPIALLGSQLCATLSMPSSILSVEQIHQLVDQGIIAFGFTAQHADVVIPLLIEKIMQVKLA